MIERATILRKFAEFQLRRRRLVQETSQEDLGAYVLQMRAQKLSETAIRLYTTVLRVFFLWKSGYLRQGLVSGRDLWELSWWVQRYRPLLHPSSWKSACLFP